MFFNYRGFLKALRLALFQRPFRLRRWFYVLLFSALYLAFVAFVALGRLLDHVFFPGFRKTSVERPVFVIAPPRSGTSFLQRVLCADEQRFVHWKMYQTIFPSICFQAVFNGLAWIDTKCGGVIRCLMQGCERKWFGGWDEMHRMRLDQPEEDQALFLYAFASEAIFMLFPFVEPLWEVGFPDALPPASRRKLMAYYRSCMQRHVYANGGGRTLLVKSTHASGAIESIAEEFPDARFITIVRHPDEAIPSHVSLFVPVWQTHSPEIERDGAESKAYAALAVEWYRHLDRFRARVEPANYYCIDYRDLRADPGRTVAALYRHFGWNVTGSYRAVLQDFTERQRTFQSTHRYSLEEFGLSKQWIRQELGPVIESHGLDGEETSSQKPQTESLGQTLVPGGHRRSSAFGQQAVIRGMQEPQEDQGEPVGHHHRHRLRAGEALDGDDDGQGDVAVGCAECDHSPAL
ncbi:MULTISPECIES: sulfotransferase family protein [Methylococcus]|uniref:Omega-hydroxy-beta-dihydromenaquinone-9 sulfotransferase n=1 Tax=Methylococcus capsulatus TaxID=414 RepID=A0AA35XTQ5_METCP|nr:sulfotransferase [Methylococcus capsulatus]QXP91908.1 sulfotransferase [Methylococcus capsulatus]CAI8813066.1 omega-hydroxy-beta-dihydromenaquinone-9 sulfotransferase [Methylococcus capsulatus]